MNQLKFKNRIEFRNWLIENALSDAGIWIIFNKQKNSDTIKSSEALEEALCFGWIDGQVQSVDDKIYLKYFKQRLKNSNWSEKNKKLVSELETKGLMTEYGRIKIENAKKNGNWNSKGNSNLTDEQLRTFNNMLKPFNNAYANFIKMPNSARKGYASSYYFGTKTEEGKQKRFNTIVKRLDLNLNPMESMKKIKNID
jgi:uncharacterized protein YdeI (YjbR/CyaY-like superfamily)